MDSITAITLLLCALMGLAHAQLVIKGSTAMAKPMDSIVRKSPVEAIYESEGTGAGQEAILEGSVDIGTGDVPIPDEIFEDGFLHIPVMVGGIAFGFNLEGIDQLLLTGCNLADIYRGNVTKWNDPSILAHNPDLEDSDLDIVAVARSDPSGSTNVVSQYFEEVCDDWDLGTGQTIDWPSDVVTVDETARVLETVIGTEGSIGYAAVGRFGVDEEASIQTAQRSFDTSGSTDFGVVGEKELPGPEESWDGVEFIFEEGGFPTSFVGFFYVPVDTSAEVLEFIQFVLSDDVQSDLPEYGFAPLPENLMEAAQAAVQVLEGSK